jgi:hypothetical protein
MDIKEAYLEMQKNCGIKVGDRVKILRKAEDFEMGWDEVWVDVMDVYVGKTGKVNAISDIGLNIHFDDLWYNFPFFVLEKIEEEYYCIGDKFKLLDPCYFGEYTLFQVKPSGVALLGLKEFNRFSESKQVKTIYRITKEEFNEISCPGAFKLIEKSPLRKEN